MVHGQKRIQMLQDLAHDCVAVKWAADRGQRVIIY